MIQEQDNQYFSITHNKELNCYDIVFKQANYDTSAELLGIMSFIHQLGVRNPNDVVRIGAMVENVNQPESN